MPKLRRSGGRRVTSSSCTRIRPRSGASKPAISRSAVVLPLPEGPSRARISPLSTVSERSRRTVWTPKLLSSRSRMRKPLTPPTPSLPTPPSPPHRERGGLKKFFSSFSPSSPGEGGREGSGEEGRGGEGSRVRRALAAHGAVPRRHPLLAVLGDEVPIDVGRLEIAQHLLRPLRQARGRQIGARRQAEG